MLEISSRRFNYKKLSLVVVGLLFALILCEIILRLFVPVGIIGHTITIYDPIYGSRLKKSYTAKWITSEFIIQYTTNSLGFRGPEPKTFPYRPILFLGDSYTEGYGVSDGEEFPELIRKQLAEQFGETRISVVNAGIENTGNAHWVKFLKNEVKRFNPRLVVLQFMDNDFNDNVKEQLFTLSPSDSLVELPVPPPSFERRIQKVIEFIPFIANSYILGLGRHIFYLLASYRNTPKDIVNVSSGIDNGFEERLTFRLWQEVLEICKQNNWPVLAIIVYINGNRLTKLENLLKRYNVESLRVPEYEDRPDLYYKVDGHWNALGHAYVAELVVKSLTVSNKYRYLFK
ncbi:MAG TPA: SGNH/GDSL hydrolase family protein [Thermodesulfobacteriota bacterium]|nr:SGNH/GDSL hydrolase family protein [Thermodesulfobacteriota bacterium]